MTEQKDYKGYMTPDNTTPNVEEWRDVVGYEDYYMISNFGNLMVKARFVRDYGRFDNEYRLKPPSIMKQSTSKGYKICRITLDGKKKMISVHRLVAEAFIPNPLEKPCVNHKDLNRANNHVSNLEWMTYRENTIHAWKSVDSKKQRLITDVDALVIWKAYKEHGYKYKELQKIYGVSSSSISRAVQKAEKVHDEYITADINKRLR